MSSSRPWEQSIQPGHDAAHAQARGLVDPRQPVLRRQHHAPDADGRRQHPGLAGSALAQGEFGDSKDLANLCCCSAITKKNS